jgi:hypothetical protein
MIFLYVASLVLIAYGVEVGSDKDTKTSPLIPQEEKVLVTDRPGIEVPAPDHKDPGACESPVVIESILPDPVGLDRDNEEVTLRNDGDSPVSMNGWVLLDREGRIWTLAQIGTIDPHGSLTVRRNRMPMSLNNTGDEITLLDPDFKPRCGFKYKSSKEGVVIQTGH